MVNFAMSVCQGIHGGNHPIAGANGSGKLRSSVITNHISSRPDIGDIRLQLLGHVYKPLLIKFNSNRFGTNLIRVWQPARGEEEFLGAKGLFLVVNASNDFNLTLRSLEHSYH